MKSIYLVGFMGSGKSTVGKALAERLKLPFIDTDNQIELKANKEIKDIFADQGEGSFRQIEHEVLVSNPDKNAVIATGGGIVELEANREWLLDKQVIYLKTSWKTIKDRLKNDRSRPIWQDQSRDKEQLLIARDQKYSHVATRTIDTDAHTIQAIVDQVQADLV